jgi:xanthine dehydrogenase accessory factor
MFRLINEKLSAGEDLVLVTVIASSGATPRGAGARMLVGKEGRLSGTIGGGAVEYRSQQMAAKVLEDKRSFEHSFNLTKDDVQKLGMICGGAVSVFFGFLPAGDENMQAIARKAEECFAAGRDLWLISDIADDGRIGLYTREEGFFGIVAPDWLKEELGRHPARIRREGRDLYVEQINSSGRVYVFGCGHVAQELVPVLAHVGFRCVALDDRPEFASKKLFPDAEEVILCDFEHLSDSITVTAEDYVCVMTRGHAFDAVVQAQMLMTEACYIGVIGSAKKKAGVYKRLKEEYGFPDEVFERITSPIGLPIRAETPAEIAISVAAQMIEFRARRNEA